MNKKQLSERIGNIDDRLIQQAEYLPNYKKLHRRRSIQRLAACAAALILMAGSFAMGMVVHAKQIASEIPVSAEMVELDEFELSLILPDNWKGRYGVERKSEDSYTIYSTETRAAYDKNSKTGGDLFYIVRWNEPLTKEQFKAGGEWNDFVSCEYISSTQEETYLLYEPSDVQFSKELQGLYLQMQSEIPEIRYVVGSEISARISVPDEAFENTTAAFIKDFSENSITVDIIEFITWDDTDRIEELGLTEDDLLPGYYIYNPDEEETTWSCAKSASYTFVDWKGNFTGTDYPAYYNTYSLKEFQKYAETYTGPPYPFFFTVKDNTITNILEKPLE